MDLGDKIKTHIAGDFWFIGTYSDNYPDSDAVLIDNGRMTLIAPKKDCVLVESSKKNAALTLHVVSVSLPTIRDMYDEANGNYPMPTQEHMKNAFMEGAKWCRQTVKELSENGNDR